MKVRKLNFDKIEYLNEFRLYDSNYLVVILYIYIYIYIYINCNDLKYLLNTYN
jgi:hypothetical protein